MKKTFEIIIKFLPLIFYSLALLKFGIANIYFTALSILLLFFIGYGSVAKTKALKIISLISLIAFILFWSITSINDYLYLFGTMASCGIGVYYGIVYYIYNIEKNIK